MILIDANLWIYYLDERMPEHPSVRTWIESLDEDSEEVLIPTVVQLEVLQAIRRLLGPDAERSMSAFFEQPATSPPLTTAIVRSAAITILVDKVAGVGSRDAAILAHAHDSGAILATHDSRLIRLAATEHIPTIDPVTAAAATSAA